MTNAYAEHMERLRQLEAASAMLAALKATHIAWGNNMERHAMDGDDTWTDEDHAEWQEGSRVIDAAIAQAKAAGITTGEE